MYRVRKTWKDSKSQKGAFINLSGAIKLCDSLEGYKVYDDNGKVVYPKSKPSTPVKEGVRIEGYSVATSSQMAEFLLSKNPNPKIKITAKELAELFLEEGRKEGIRGDIAFCQSVKETGWFRYGGQVLSEQNNYCGLGATNNSPIGKGAWFDTERLGVRAQIQHLKAYANKEPLNSECIDPRFKLVSRGIAPRWIDLNGRWAVPGKGYGESILSIYTELLKVKVEEEVEVDYTKIILELEKKVATLEKELVKSNKLVDTTKKELEKSNSLLEEIKTIINR